MERVPKRILLPQNGGKSSIKGSHYKGDLLMVRRFMSILEGEENAKSQREIIFHASCLVLGKLCSLIIDGGNSVNAVSLRQVEKLTLPSLPHLRPYTLQWLSEKGVLV
ncbi:hypothetical protein CR513_38659, partial [Mucuna pruriens]